MSVNLYKNGDLIPIAGNGGGVDVDAELSAESENPVQNKAIAQKFNAIDTEMESVKKSVGDGKEKIAAAITGKGIDTAADADFATMADNIGSITGGSAESYESVRVENISFAGLHDFDIPSKLGRASIPYVINPSFKENKIEIEMTVAKNYEKLEKEPILSGVVA